MGRRVTVSNKNLVNAKSSAKSNQERSELRENCREIDSEGGGDNRRFGDGMREWDVRRVRTERSWRERERGMWVFLLLGLARDVSVLLGFFFQFLNLRLLIQNRFDLLINEGG